MIPPLSPLSHAAPLANPADAQGRFLVEKPTLSPPQRAEWAVIKSICRLDEAGEKLVAFYHADLDKTMGELKSLNERNAKQLQESVQRSQESGAWSLLRKIGACFLSAISTALGFSVGSHTILGGMLIASGVVSVANLAFSETGIWNWVAKKLARDNREKEEQFKVLIPAAIGVIAAAAGMAGSAGALLRAPLSFSQQLLTILNTAVNLSEGVAALGQGVADSKVLWSESALTELQKEIWQTHSNLEKNASGVERFCKVSADAVEKALNIVQLSTRSSRAALLKG